MSGGYIPIFGAPPGPVPRLLQSKKRVDTPRDLKFVKKPQKWGCIHPTYQHQLDNVFLFLGTDCWVVSTRYTGAEPIVVLYFWVRVC